MSINIRSAPKIQRRSAEVDEMADPSDCACEYSITVLGNKPLSLENAHTKIVSRTVGEDELASLADFWTHIKLVYRKAFLRYLDHKANARRFEGPFILSMTFKGTLKLPTFTDGNWPMFTPLLEAMVHHREKKVNLGRMRTLYSASDYEQTWSMSFRFDQPQRSVFMAANPRTPKETPANICQVVYTKLGIIRTERQVPLLILEKLPEDPMALHRTSEILEKLELCAQDTADDGGAAIEYEICQWCNKEHRTRDCRNCHDHRHEMLCTVKPSDETPAELPAITGVPQETASASSNESTSSSSSSSSKPEQCDDTVILATASIFLRAEKGRQSGRLLCDPGSQISCITESMANKIELQLQSSRVIIEGIGAAETHAAGKGVVYISPYFGGREIQMEVHVLNRITSKLPSASVSAECCLHLKAIQLADPDFRKPAPIDLLLGADYFGEILEDGVISGTKHKPGAVRTRFGWMVFGPAAVIGTVGVARTSSMARPHSIQGLARRLDIKMLEEPTPEVASTIDKPSSKGKSRQRGRALSAVATVTVFVPEELFNRNEVGEDVQYLPAEENGNELVTEVPENSSSGEILEGTQSERG